MAYNYITLNGKVVRQTWTENDVDYVFDIIYDVNGRPYACFYQGIIYYYVCNLQGDVIRIINGNTSQTLVEYTYDAWGNVLSITGSMKDTLGEVNPIRYRGYYYDTETGFYYLQSRYYDPSIGRFINADSYASTGQGFLGYNMFAYCYNYPVGMADYYGKDAIYVTDYRSDGGLPFVGHAIVYIQDENGDWYETEYTGFNFDKSTAQVFVNNADDEMIQKMLNSEQIPGYEYTYLEGDFTASLALAREYEGSDYGGYNLVLNSCLDYAQEILCAGTFKNNIQKKYAQVNRVVPHNYHYDLRRGALFSKLYRRGVEKNVESPLALLV